MCFLLFSFGQDIPNQNEHLRSLLHVSALNSVPVLTFVSHFYCDQCKPSGALTSLYFFLSSLLIQYPCRNKLNFHNFSAKLQLGRPHLAYDEMVTDPRSGSTVLLSLCSITSPFLHPSSHLFFFRSFCRILRSPDAWQPHEQATMPRCFLYFPLSRQFCYLISYLTLFFMGHTPHVVLFLFSSLALPSTRSTCLYEILQCSRNASLVGVVVFFYFLSVISS